MKIRPQLFKDETVSSSLYSQYPSRCSLDDTEWMNSNTDLWNSISTIVIDFRSLPEWPKYIVQIYS